MKMQSVFEIGANGLKRIGNETICIYAGGSYHYGGSSSPDPVLVESVGKDYVTFRSYPYTKPARREQLSIFRWLAQKGTATKLESLGQYAKCIAADPSQSDPAPWLEPMMAHYRAVLAGEQSRVTLLDDVQMVRVEVAYSAAGDAWSIFERYHPHAVSHAKEEEGRTVLTSYDFSRAEARKLEQSIAAGELPGFTFVGTSERDD